MTTSAPAGDLGNVPPPREAATPANHPDQACPSDPADHPDQACPADHTGPAGGDAAATAAVARPGGTAGAASEIGPGPGRWVGRWGAGLRVGRWGPGVGAVAVLLAAAVPWIRDRPLWLDEAYTVGATHDLVATWRGSGGTQALYYLVTWPVTRVSTDAAWLRFPSVVVAAGAVLATYALGTRLRSRRAGALAALALASTWALARYAIEARSYALATLLVTLSWWGLVGVVDTADTDETDETGDPAATRRWWRLHAAALLLAPLAHGMAALHFAGQLVAWAVAPPGRTPWRRVALLGAALATEGALLFAVGAGEVAEWVPPLSTGQAVAVVNLLVGPGPVGLPVGAVALVAAVLAVRSYATDRTVTAWRSVVPVIWALAAPLALLTLSAVRPYGIARYVLGSLPAVALLVGAGLDRLRPRWAPLVGAAVVVGLLLVPHERVTEGGREDWPALVERLRVAGNDGERLAVPEKYRPPIDHYWPDRGAPALVPASPTDPLGDVRRFYDDDDPVPPRELLLADTGTVVWYVDRGAAGLARTEALLGDPAVAAAYEAGPTETFTGRLHLTRFTPRQLVASPT